MVTSPILSSRYCQLSSIRLLVLLTNISRRSEDFSHLFVVFQFCWVVSVVLPRFRHSFTDCPVSIPRYADIYSRRYVHRPLPFLKRFENWTGRVGSYSSFLFIPSRYSVFDSQSVIFFKDSPIPLFVISLIQRYAESVTRRINGAFDFPYQRFGELPKENAYVMHTPIHKVLTYCI